MNTSCDPPLNPFYLELIFEVLLTYSPLCIFRNNESWHSYILAEENKKYFKHFQAYK